MLSSPRIGTLATVAQQNNHYDPGIWESESPEDCHFERSAEITGVALTLNVIQGIIPVNELILKGAGSAKLKKGIIKTGESSMMEVKI